MAQANRWVRRHSAREEVHYESDLHSIIAHRVGNRCLRPSSSPEEVLAALAERDRSSLLVMRTRLHNSWRMITSRLTLSATFRTRGQGDMA